MDVTDFPLDFCGIKLTEAENTSLPAINLEIQTSKG